MSTKVRIDTTSTDGEHWSKQKVSQEMHAHIREELQRRQTETNTTVAKQNLEQAVRPDSKVAPQTPVTPPSIRPTVPSTAASDQTPRQPTELTQQRQQAEQAYQAYDNAKEQAAALERLTTANPPERAPSARAEHSSQLQRPDSTSSSNVRVPPSANSTIAGERGPTTRRSSTSDKPGNKEEMSESISTEETAGRDTPVAKLSQRQGKDADGRGTADRDSAEADPAAGHVSRADSNVTVVAGMAGTIATETLPTQKASRSNEPTVAVRKKGARPYAQPTSNKLARLEAGESHESSEVEADAIVAEASGHGGDPLGVSPELEASSTLYLTVAEREQEQDFVRVHGANEKYLRMVKPKVERYRKLSEAVHDHIVGLTARIEDPEFVAEILRASFGSVYGPKALLA